ncbi:transcription factor MYB124 isoform X2 [Brachypodium distachyon]|uniref:Uncharacterized protein n=3 Tax=Brachypodium distachyon TaxID=15368 RepID=I1GS31_BRADI|nr:transcription factor MYB124 isoform X2 [Brachypodium distachyon]KQK15093.1 hypothetical protein BRADI_1g20586v3 [Brachypodium distachyon]|eukprot:XP_014751826.1 transcription factor MYB124 isoform X2 [Brachypodium distachyon]
MATGPDLTSSSPAAAAAASSVAAKKDRHIVSWSAEEDDVLRAQIAHHGTDNWTIIATQFNDKTARQCRRRWYNYLNTECKKGGWSREEDMLLCEAQKLLGNKWTEIAKVVSGRTDNAVKNRFSTLCKRRSKDDELVEENGSLCSNENAKRVLTQTGDLTSSIPGSSLSIKQMRSRKPDFKENMAPNMRSFGQEKSIQQHSRQPLANISPNNQHNVNIVGTQNDFAKDSTMQLHGNGQTCVKNEGNFLKSNDPKFATLLQQADLLSSLATKLNTENTSQSMDEAWQQLQHHLVKKEDNEMLESSISGTASLLEELDDLIVDPYENEEEDERKEQNEQTDVSSKHSNGPLETSMQVTSQMALDMEIDICPIDKSTPDNSLCGNFLSSTPGVEITASVNLGEAAEDSGLYCMEYSSPAHAVLQAKADAEIPAAKILSEAAEGSWSQFMEYTSPAQTVVHAKADAEIPVSISLSEAAEGSWHQRMEYMSPAHTLLRAKADAEIPASVNSSEAAKDCSLQCTEYTSPAHTDLRAADVEILDTSSEIAQDCSLKCIKFTSPAHTAIEGKAEAKMPALENCSEVPKDSSTQPGMEFTSPAHTVPTFQRYTDDVPTPKITASERNFLLSVLGLTSPGSKPDTSQQPSCKRALLNSL